MRSNLEIVKTYIDSAWSNPPKSILEANKTYLAEDFKSIDKDNGVQMDKAAYMGMTSMFISAFSNLKWVRSALRQEGDGVFMTGHFEGKHTGDADLSAMGLGVIKATGKFVVWPESTVEYKIEGEKIKSQKATGDGGGIAAMLAPLGVKIPSA